MATVSFGSMQTLRGLSDRNQLAQLKIVEVAAMHGALDVAIGIAGTVVPGAGTAGLFCSIALQVPVYQGLVRSLSDIYSAPPDRLTTHLIIESTAIGGAAMVLGDLTADFLQELAKEILKENGWSFLLSGIPVVGGVVAASLDLAIAATMTWRIGTMVSIYYQNGSQWIGSVNSTYAIVKRLTGPRSVKNEGRVNFDLIPDEVPEVFENQVLHAISLIEMFRQMDSVSSDQKIQEILTGQGFPAKPIEEALRRLRSKSRWN